MTPPTNPPAPPAPPENAPQAPAEPAPVAALAPAAVLAPVAVQGVLPAHHMVLTVTSHGFNWFINEPVANHPVNGNIP